MMFEFTIFYSFSASSLPYVNKTPFFLQPRKKDKNSYQFFIYFERVYITMDTEIEDNPDSVRFIWNTTPSSKVQQARSVIHPAFHYTPLAATNVPRLEYAPLTCSCEAVFNKFSRIDFHRKTVECSFCNVSMPLPPNYAKAITPDKLPYELNPQISTFEYKIESKTPPKQDLPATSNNCLLFLVDLCILEKEMEAVKQSLAEAVAAIPANGSYFVGLITFNKNVHVYELSSKINTVFCINGLKEYNNFDIMAMLGVAIKNDPTHKSYDVFKRYIIQIKNKADSDKVIRRIRDIRRDQTITVNERSPRATGQALNVALSMC